MEPRDSNRIVPYQSPRYHLRAPRVKLTEKGAGEAPHVALLSSSGEAQSDMSRLAGGIIKRPTKMSLSWDASPVAGLPCRGRRCAACTEPRDLWAHRKTGRRKAKYSSPKARASRHEQLLPNKNELKGNGRHVSSETYGPHH